MWLRFLVVFLLSILVLGTSCKRPSSEQTNRDIDAPEEQAVKEPVSVDFEDIVEHGTLKALVETSSTGYFLYKGTPMGYEYELLKRFAEDMGLKLQLIIVSDIQKAFDHLNEGNGDIIAFNLSVTRERKDEIAFTEHHSLQRQVLVQRKPQNWRKMKLHEIEADLIRDPIELGGKEIYVRKNSAFVPRLRNLSDEIGEEILIVEEFGNVETEELIKRVANSEIDFTIADENVGQVNSTYYPILDVNTPISFSQKIAWGVRRNSPELLDTLNHWIINMRKKADYYVIYNKYFKNSKSAKRIAASEFQSISGDKLSPYDDLIKAGARELGWDWLLLASQVYQESRFDPKSVSWAGAQGLMQLMPVNVKAYGLTNAFDPEQSIKAGVRHLKWLEGIWDEKVSDEDERIKFILASYNIGQAHILDARKLASKYGYDPEIWEGNVEKFLLKKSDPEFYRDPVVTAGYARGTEPVKYVQEIFDRYEQYKMLAPKQEVVQNP